MVHTFSSAIEPIRFRWVTGPLKNPNSMLQDSNKIPAIWSSNDKSQGLLIEAWAIGLVDYFAPAKLRARIDRSSEELRNEEPKMKAKELERCSSNTQALQAANSYVAAKQADAKIT
jgi:hypothetical protein